MISIEKNETTITIVVIGQFDYDTSEELTDLVKNKWTDLNAKNINLDLSRVNYINSMGIGTIVNIFKIFKERGKKMTILNPQQNVFKILKLTRINEVIPVENEEIEKNEKK